MAKDDIDVPWRSCQDILDRLENLNACLIILDKPRIAVPTQAQLLILELKDMLSEMPLSARDQDMVKRYLTAAEGFCDGYFEAVEFSELPAITLLKLPCDSHELLKAHERLYLRYLRLCSNLRESLRKRQAKSCVN